MNQIHEEEPKQRVRYITRWQAVQMFLDAKEEYGFLSMFEATFGGRFEMSRNKGRIIWHPDAQ